MLDFNNDGSVSTDDVKNSMFSLYEYLKNFEVIETATTIKGKLYKEAIVYMQKELDEDERARELKNEQIQFDANKIE